RASTRFLSSSYAASAPPSLSLWEMRSLCAFKRCATSEETKSGSRLRISASSRSARRAIGSSTAAESTSGAARLGCAENRLGQRLALQKGENTRLSGSLEGEARQITREKRRVRYAGSASPDRDAVRMSTSRLTKKSGDLPGRRLPSLSVRHRS